MKTRKASPDSTQTITSGRLFEWLLVAALLMAFFLLGLTASREKSLTGDEGPHLAGGVTYWAFNDYRVQPNNGNWPQRVCGLPVWLAGHGFPFLEAAAWRELRQWDLGDEFLYQSEHDAGTLLVYGRAMTALLGVALGLLVYCWSRSLFGPAGGLLSLALYAFSPAMLTHGFLITSDLAAALCFTASAGMWKLMHRVSVGNMLLASLSVSALCLSKFSAPALMPMAFLMFAARSWVRGALDHWAGLKPCDSRPAAADRRVACSACDGRDGHGIRDLGIVWLPLCNDESSARRAAAGGAVERSGE